ncbi:MAG TPA: uracil-DNA glycosylase [Vicinamibacterales bacterium]
MPTSRPNPTKHDRRGFRGSDRRGSNGSRGSDRVIDADALAAVHHQIVSCNRCDRLRSYCRRIAVEKKAAHRDEEYWGRPVPGFGDRRARVLVIGLAPAAHGANRTGRVFTGDGPRGSGDFLMRAMHRAGFASIPTARHPDDGLQLIDAYIAAAVRCAPPDNKPTPAEILACHPHLVAEAAALPNVNVIVALGRIGFDAAWRLLADRGVVLRPKPPFAHDAAYAAGGYTVIASYHPSRQNTNTGKLTAEMMDAVFRRARRLTMG